MIFKYREYIKFLDHLKLNGKLETFSEWKGDNVFLLRHDIDLDIAMAGEIAKIENNNNVKSTFFILTTGNTYNPLSINNRVIIKQIVLLGHEIGLHFDPTVYDNLPKEILEQKAKMEASIIEEITGNELRAISLHNPSVHYQYPIFSEFINAYDKKIFNESSYIADSRMDFRGENIYDFVLRVKTNPVQILLHPMHFSEEGLGYPDNICTHIINYIKFLDDDYSENSTYNEIMNTSLFNYLYTKYV